MDGIVRSHGKIGEVEYQRSGWCFVNQGYRVVMRRPGEDADYEYKTVYPRNGKELRDAVTDYGRSLRTDRNW